MGQIVSTVAKPKRCNLSKLSQLGTPAAGEYILVSSDNSMNAAGQGNFDCYIVGDGITAATELELKEINPQKFTYSKVSEFGIGKYRSATSNAGIGCVFDYITNKEYRLSAIALAASYTGEAYFAIATIESNTCTIDEMHKVSLNGLYTDLFDKGICVPSGKAVGLFGVSNTHSVSGKGFFKMGTPPSVGDTVSGANNVSDATIILADAESSKDVIDNLQEDAEISEKIIVGDLSGATALPGGAICVDKTTYDYDYYVTKMQLPVSVTGYVVIVIGTPTGSSLVINSMLPVYLNNVSEIDLSDRAILLREGSCIGFSGAGVKAGSKTNGGYYASNAQTGDTISSGNYIPSVKWELEKTTSLKSLTLSLKNEINDLEDSLSIESDEQVIGVAAGGDGFAGYCGIYKTQVASDKLLKTIELETAYNGSAYVLIAEKVDSETCTIVARHEVTLTGNETDVSSYNIIVPVGHCVGLAGVSNAELYRSENSWFEMTTPYVGKTITKNNYAINAAFTLVKKSDIGTAVQNLSNEVNALSSEIDALGNPSSITKSSLYEEDFTSSDGSSWAESASGVMSLSASGLSFANSGDTNYIQLKRMYALNGREMSFRVVLYSDTILKVGQKLYNSSSPTYNCIINCPAGTISIGNATSNFSFVNGEEYIVRWIAGLSDSKIYIQSVKSGNFASAQTTRNAYLDTYVFSLNAGTSPVIKSIKISACVANPYVIFMGDSITQGTGVTSFAKMYGNIIGEQLQKPYGVSGRGQGSIYSIIGENSFIGRLYTEVEPLRPKYLVVMIGTNSGNTAGNLSSLCEVCASWGVTLILNNIPCNNAGTTTSNDLISQTRSNFNLEGMRMDLATSVDNNGATANSSLYADTNLHPNDAGHYQMYLRSFIDTPDLYINAGVEPVAVALSE